MSLAENLTQLERQLAALITRYEQYFIGLEKREPLQLFGVVEKQVRQLATTPITNTMYKYKLNTLTARFNTYREHWNRILRQIEEGKYSRDRFISDLHQRQRGEAQPPRDQQRQQASDTDLDRVFNELREARKNCHLPFESLTRDMVAATIEKSKPALVARLGTDNITFRVVIEDGKPKLKAAPRK